MALTRNMQDALEMAANLDTMGEADDQTVNEDAAGIDNDGESVIEPGVAFDTPSDTAAPMPMANLLASALSVSRDVQDRAAKSVAAMKAAAGSKTLTDEQIKALIITEREHAARGAAVKTTNIIAARKPRTKINLGPQGKAMIARSQAEYRAATAGGSDIMVHPDAAIREFERVTIAEAKARWGGGPIDVRPQAYYSQKGLVVAGDATAGKETCGFSVNAGTVATFFDYDMNSTTFQHFGSGGATAVTVPQAGIGRTNIQNPGTGLYSREILVVHETELQLLGMRVQYSPTDLTAMGAKVTALQTAILQGKGALADDDSILLSPELVNEYTGDNRLLLALLSSGSLAFKYDNREGQGDIGTKIFQLGLLGDVIEQARNEGTTQRRFVRKLNRAYAMTLDPNLKTAGVMTGILTINDAAYFSAKPVTVNSLPFFPAFLELVFKFTVRGNRIMPASDITANAQRS
jgi:hypothetical protein